MDAQLEALYIHVPFCASKCFYCSFCSNVPRENEINDYLASITSQLKALKNEGLLLDIKTVYIGGGTPTLLGVRLLDLIESIRRSCGSNIKEFTVEANPESLTSELVNAFEEGPVTRVSMGVQSFDDDVLKALGRIHSAEMAKAKVKMLSQASLDASIDLMCGTPHQSMESFQSDLEYIVSTDIQHVSIYPLSVEEGTKMDELIEKGLLADTDQYLQADMMEEAQRVLVSGGFHRYEVASYARGEHEARHNKAYWTGKQYLGLGVSAASMMDKNTFLRICKILNLNYDVKELALCDAHTRVRYKVEGLLERKMQPKLEVEVELLTPLEAAAEDIMLGMRMSDGISTSVVDDFCQKFPMKEKIMRSAIDTCVKKGLALYNNESDARFVPTQNGWLLGNELYGALWGVATNDQ